MMCVALSTASVFPMWMDVAAGYSADWGFRTEEKLPWRSHIHTLFPVISVSRLQTTTRHTLLGVVLSLGGKEVIVRWGKAGIGEAL